MRTEATFERASLFAGIDAIVAAVTPLHLAWPVLVAPPIVSGGLWTAKSDAQNRTLRTSLQLDASGTIVRREDFGQQQWIDRWVETGVAAHEGQLFGLVNQLLGLFTAICLVVLSISALVLWWRRRPSKVLGAPIYQAPERPLALSFVLVLVLFCIYLPLLGCRSLPLESSSCLCFAEYRQRESGLGWRARRRLACRRIGGCRSIGGHWPPGTQRQLGGNALWDVLSPFGRKTPDL